jgi:patatin-like phospholipase/acyl hydrolase
MLSNREVFKGYKTLAVQKFEYRMTKTIFPVYNFGKHWITHIGSPSNDQ